MRARLILTVTTLALAFGLSVAAIAQIYRWVDENGVTHYSEKKPADKNNRQRAKDISADLKRVGNLITFVDPGPIDYYQPRTQRRDADVQINIEAFGYTMGKAQRQTIDEQVRGLYQAYVRWFDWSLEPTHPVNIKIFGKYELFEQYQIEHRGRFITNRSHYSPYHREVLMLSTEFEDTTLQTLLHEVSHAVMDMQVRRASKWLNEGIAGMFEGLVYKRGKINMLYAGAWSERMNLKLREGSLASLETYLNIPDRQWGSESARVESTYYMIAWSLMRYMITTEQGMRALALTLQQQRFYREAPGELVKTINDAYPGGIRALDADWRNWLAAIG